MQYCKKCFDKGESHNFEDWKSRGLHYDVSNYLENSYCEGCAWKESDVEKEVELFRCECGEEKPRLTECGICDKNVCDSCLKSGNCHMDYGVFLC